MGFIACKHCGKQVIGLLRGRHRRFCSDRCRLASHRRGKATRLRQGASEFIVRVPDNEPGGLQAWGAWLRGAYELDRTGEELLRLILEADRRYQQARDALNLHGLTQPGADGRATARPEVAIERDTRAAIARLITQLDLEDDVDDTQAPRHTTARFHRVAG
jgi:hypothetical protein